MVYNAMVDWKAPGVQLTTVKAFGKIVNALYGLYVWEFIISFNFEWDYLSGKKKFRWPLIFYFANRYIVLMNLTATLVLFNKETKSASDLNCHALFMITNVTGNMTLGLTSINLAIRTFVLWAQNVFVIVSLTLMIIGHWVVIIVQARTSVGYYLPGIGCINSGYNIKLLIALFFYSLCLDTIIMSLTAIKLFAWSPKSLFSGGLSLHPTRKPGLFKLSNIVFQQGLIFYMIAFAVNLLEITMLFLDLNISMNGLFAIVAELTSSIVACRAVRSLSTFMDSGNKVNMVPTTATAPHSSRGYSSGTTKQPLNLELDTFRKDGISQDTSASRSEQASGLNTLAKPTVL